MGKQAKLKKMRRYFIQQLIKEGKMQEAQVFAYFYAKKKNSKKWDPETRKQLETLRPQVMEAKRQAKEAAKLQAEKGAKK